MHKLRERVAAMCAAPAGCMFLLSVEATGLSSREVSRPQIALHLAVEAVSAISPWAGDHEQVIAGALSHGHRLRSLCRELLSEPESAWWFGQLERHSQEWISRAGEAPSADRVKAPLGAPDEFELRTQKPGNGLFTSTGAGNTSGAIALLTDGYGDYDVDLPLVRYGVDVRPGARVFEIEGPDAWYRLCMTFPAEAPDGRIVPNWEKVAQSWDGVHLTLGGLLTIEQVRLEGTAGWVEHAGWDTEQTAWLHWAFEKIERFPDIQQLPRPFSPL